MAINATTNGNNNNNHARALLPSRHIKDMMYVQNTIAANLMRSTNMQLDTAIVMPAILYCFMLPYTTFCMAKIAKHNNDAYQYTLAGVHKLRKKANILFCLQWEERRKKKKKKRG